MQKYIYSFICFVILLGGGKIFAQSADTLGVDEIVAKANLSGYYAGGNGSAKARMVITDEKGKKRLREFNMIRKNIQEGGNQKFFLYFKKPSDVRKMSFMVHKHIKKEDDRWLFLPALDLVRRIASSDKRTSFVGSDFLYEDISGRLLDEDTHELIESTKGHFIIKNVPKRKDEVEFSHYDVWIDKTNFLAVKSEYFNKQGIKYRRIEAEEILEIQGVPTITKIQVQNLVSGGNTILSFEDVKYGLELKDDLFSERYLRKPPRKLRR